jgi:hypothetical protein
MVADRKLEIIKAAHQKYVDWWLPIDVAASSAMAPMSCHRFFESLLTFNDEWWERWIGDSIPKEDKIAFKRLILNHIIGYYGEVINLNK